jgi:YegS/Rv2252/BmrU family lipid kinase
VNPAAPTWFVIVNPAGGNGAVKVRWAFIEAALKQSGLPLEIVFTEAPGHATTLAREAIEKGFRHLVAVGGDGTGNETVNGILQQEVVDSQTVTFALMPVGTGNDWVRFWKVPKQTEAWLDMLKAGKTAFQDVGVARFMKDGKEGLRYFINVAGMAYDAFVVKYSEQRKYLLKNRFFYLWLVFTCLWKYRLSRARVAFDGQVVEDLFYTINAGILPYSGGGMQLVPQAVPDDGLLALTFARKLSKLGVILNTWRFYNGSIGEHPLISTLSAKTVKITSLDDEPIYLEADGEWLGQTPVEFSILPNALKIVIP